MWGGGLADDNMQRQRGAVAPSGGAVPLRVPARFGLVVTRPAVLGVIAVAFAFALAAVAAAGPLGVGKTLALLTLAGLGVVLVVGEVRQRLRSHRHATSSARNLAEAGAALLTAEGALQVAARTVEAVRRLVGAHTPGDVVVACTEGGALAVLAADLTPGAPPAALPVRALPPYIRSALERGTSVRTSEVCIVHGALLRPRGLDGQQTLLVPLISRTAWRGVIALAHPGDLDACDCDEVVARLASSVALALDSVLLTEDLVRSEIRFRSLVQHSSDVIVVLGRDGVPSYLSPTIRRVLGYTPRALTGTDLAAVLHPDDLGVWEAFRARVLAGDVAGPLECRLRHRTGDWRHTEIVASNLLDEPSVAGIVLSVRDIGARKVLEDELVRRAYHDPLTDLANRALFLAELRAAVDGAEDRDRLAVIFVDLDDFKGVNDALGHATGDRVLQEAARRLRGCLRTGDRAARLSGDEFAVLLRTVDQPEEGGAVAERMLAALNEPCTVGGQAVRLRASVGVAVGADPIEEAEDLLHRADLAMYAAKGGGKNHVQIFHPQSAEARNGKRQLRADLQWAVLRGELEVRYQPIVHLDDGRMAGAEALVRWRHPDYGLLGPDAFVTLAEESDLIADLFEVVLRDACEQALRWRKRTGPGEALSVSVNVSAVQLHSPQLVEQVTRILGETGLEPGLLTLEITETVLVSDPELACDTLGRLKRLGVRIAIDDFGTGYSSLAYLRRLPIDVLKIDRLFLHGMDRRDTAALAATIIDLGRRLGMPTVAEGVERPQQRDRLRELGCSHGQGHLFSRPVTSQRMERLVVQQGAQPSRARG